MYRGTSSSGDQWQECWDSTDRIIKECVNDGPNTGWVNGPNLYQVDPASLITLVAQALSRNSSTKAAIDL